jgi:hypothetical protein
MDNYFEQVLIRPVSESIANACGLGEYSDPVNQRYLNTMDKEINEI